MEKSCEYYTYHLTHNGWIVAEHPPLDRVETWICAIEVAGRSKRYVEWTRMWTNPEVSQAERDALRERFTEDMRTVGRDHMAAVAGGSL
jgi:hypothetical protein